VGCSTFLHKAPESSGNLIIMAELSFIPRIAALHELQSMYLEPKLKKLGISLNTFQLLAAIAAAGEDASQIEIARRLGVSPATLSETVQVHIKRKLLEQTPSTVDRRVKILTLTKSANSKLRDVRELLESLEETMLKNMSGSTVKSTFAALDDAIENVQKSLKK
jgi:DNA-binding MarR family transcriptional regulator